LYKTIIQLRDKNKEIEHVNMRTFTM